MEPDASFGVERDREVAACTVGSEIEGGAVGFLGTSIFSLFVEDKNLLMI